MQDVWNQITDPLRFYPKLELPISGCLITGMEMMWAILGSSSPNEDAKTHPEYGIKTSKPFSYPQTEKPIKNSRILTNSFGMRKKNIKKDGRKND